MRALQEQAEVLAQRSKVLTLKQMLDDQQKRVNAQQTSLATITPQVAQQFQMSPETLKILADMLDEQRDKLMASVMLMNARGSASGDMMAYLWPIMTMQMKANPGASTADMVKWAEGYTNSIRTGFDMAQQQMNPIELVKWLSELTKGSIEDKLTQFLQQNRAEPSVFEKLITEPALYDRAKPT